MNGPAQPEPSGSYALGDPAEVARRLEAIDKPHMRPLNRLRERILEAMGPEFETPNFDPSDGGIAAELLILLEAPGSKAVGSHFVSRNNPDPTARNMNALLREAAIPRSRTLLWNVVPWYIGSGKKIRAADSSDLRSAQPWTRELIELLPRLKVVVLAGQKAQRLGPFLRGITACPVLHSFHPSNLSLNRDPSRRGQVLAVFKSAAGMLGTKDWSSGDQGTAG